jgi:hypothetical protein
MFIEMNQCIVKKQIRQVVVLKTDANTFGECPSMSLKFITPFLIQNAHFVGSYEW